MNDFPLYQKPNQLSLMMIMAYTFLFVFVMSIPAIHAASVSFSWQANTEADLAGYNIYIRSLSSTNYGSPVFSGLTSTPSSPQKTITNIIEGDSYAAIVTAYDNAGNESGPSNEQQFTVPASTATSTLTITKSGNGSGTVSSNPAGLNCGNTCNASFPRNDSITLSAGAATNSFFSGWSGGGCSGTNTSCTVTLTQNTTVTAIFQPTPTTAGQPNLVTPIPGSTISGETATFSWTSNGTAVTEWWLYVGTSQGSKNILTSGSISSSTHSRTVSGLPTNGSPIWVKLWWRTASAGWQSADFQYSSESTQPTTTGPPTLITPIPGSTISGGTTTFAWAPNNGTAVTEWWLYVGTSQGSKDILTSGSISNSTHSRTVSGLPTNGNAVWVKLWWRIPSGTWKNADFQYSTRR